MKTTKVWLWWAVVILLFAYDMVIGIPNRVFVSFLLIAVVWALGELHRRLEALDLKSGERCDAIAKRLDEVNKRLRWVEFKFFGADRYNMLSGEWSARHHAEEYKP
jgi:hypothetical protein